MRRHVYDNAPTTPPRYWPGDKVQEAGEPEEIGIVEFARRDGLVCLRWPSGKKEWLHESVLIFAPGFQPSGRR